MALDGLTEEPPQKTTAPLGVEDRVFIRDDDQCWVVAVKEIVLLQAEGNYTRVYFARNEALLYRSLQMLESRLPADRFFRVSRSHVINVHAITGIENEKGGQYQVALQNGAKILISRRQARAFREKLSL